MIQLQLKSDASGIWLLDTCPIGWEACHEDYDGAEDAWDMRHAYGKTLEDVIHDIKEYDKEYCHE